MEVSILVGALSFLAYSLITPSFRMKLTGEELRYPVNKYFGDNVDTTLDLARIHVSKSTYGAITVTPKNVNAMCGDNYWAKCKAKMVLN